MQILKRTAWLVASVAFAMALSACAFLIPVGPEGKVAGLSAEKVVGMWQQTAGDGLMALRADGSAEGSHLPWGIFGEFITPFGVVADASVAGKWDLEHSQLHPDDPPSIVDITLESVQGVPVPAYGFNLSAQERKGVLTLVVWIGDPDSRDEILFTKCVTACPALPVGS